MFFYRIISYFFHPILFPTIATFLYFTVLPSHIPEQSKRIILGIVFATTYIVPLLMIFFLKQFKIIEDYHLKTIEERRFPVIFMTLLFFLLGKLLLDAKIVNLLAFSFFGCGISLIFIYILFSLKIKSSLHAMSVAGLIGLVCVMSYQYEQNYLMFIVTLFLLFGIIATSRLHLKAHTHAEIYTGFIIGFISQFIIYSFYLKFN